MNILAIDPGNNESAYVLYDADESRLIDFGKTVNANISDAIAQADRCGVHDLIIEKIASYGMPVGEEVFATCRWSGRFEEKWKHLGGDVHYITRLQVKHHLCHSSKANDGTIRQAIIDRFGGKEAAIGKKASPGPLYGVSKDVWAALAVALTFADQLQPAGGK